MKKYSELATDEMRVTQRMSEMMNENDFVKYWLYKMDIKNYTINDDLTVDVDGDVTISNKGLTNIPIKFNKVNGHFHCSFNKLTSLEGCPKEVNGRFTVNHNRLTSLKGCPIKVNGGFNCSNNRITSLKDCHSEINGDFNCSRNKLTLLEYIPKNINGEFECNDNPLPILLKDNISIVFKYHDEYSIWKSDGSFNNGRWRIFQKDFKKGLLT